MPLPIQSPLSHTQRLRRLAILAAATLAFVICQPVGAQAVGTRPSTAHSTRAELDEALLQAERLATSRDSSSEVRARYSREASRLRERLRSGDFQPGDRVVLSVENDATLADTFVVRAGRRLVLPNVGDVLLEGVLRSELRAHLTQEIGRYIRNPNVSVNSLVRIAVLGEVGHPGYFAVAPDLLLSDVIMVAGGPTGTANLQNMSIRRDNAELLPREDVQQAISLGLTLDQLAVRAGDELVVGRRSDRSFQSALRTAGVIGSLLVTVYGATRFF